MFHSIKAIYGGTLFLPPCRLNSKMKYNLFKFVLRGLLHLSIKELEKENLDLKIRMRIVESQEKETQKKISYRHYKMLIIGYVFSTILASHIGELGTLIACTIALLILHLKEVKK